MGLDFLYRYLLYFFRLIIPFSFKSVVVQLNISKDTRPVLTLVVVIDDGSNQDGWYGIDMVVEGFVVSICSFGTNVGDSMSASSGVCEE